MGQYGKKVLGEFTGYASETIQNCKNPTGRIDTLRGKISLKTTPSVEVVLTGTTDQHSQHVDVITTDINCRLE